MDDPLGAPLDLEPRSPVVAARTPERCSAARAAGGLGADASTGVWRRAIARDASPARPRPAAPPGDLAGPRARPPREQSSPRPASCRPPLPPPESVDRGAGSRRTSRRCADAGPILGRRPSGSAPTARARSARCHRGRRRARRRGRRARRLHRPPRARPVRARPARSRAPPRLLLVAPNLDAAARSSRPTARAADAGSRSTRSPTRCSSAPSTGCARTSAACCASCSPRRGQDRPARAAQLASTTSGAGRAVREGGLVRRGAGAERKAVLDRVQATMALIEGHAEHVMDAAGGEVLRRRRRPARRAGPPPRGTAPPLLRIARAPARPRPQDAQYAQGRRFCDAVVARRGDDGLARAWAAPELRADLGRARRPGLAGAHRPAAA